MSEQQQCKVRFYRQGLPRFNPRTSVVTHQRCLDPHVDSHHSASSQGRTASKKCPSIEALSLYGDESPSPPAEMSTAVRCPSPSPSPHLSLFERMKGAEVPRPPSPPHDWVPTSQKDMEMDARETSGEIAVQSPSLIPDLSLYERMRCAQVPAPPSPPPEWVPPPKEDREMELASSGSKALESPTSSRSHFLFERMKRAEVPKPPSPPHDWVPTSQKDTEMDMRESSAETVAWSPSTIPDLSLYERMRRAQVPAPPSPPQEWIPLPEEDWEMQLASSGNTEMDVRESLGETVVRSLSTMPDLSLYERMRRAQVPAPLSPPQEWVPLPEEDGEMEMAESSGSKAVQSPTSPPSLSLFETMKRAKVPMPPSPPRDWVPPSFQVAEVDVQLSLPSTDGPAPHSPFRDLHVDQGDEPNRGRRIDFGDPERGRLRERFDTGMRGPTPTYDERQELVQSGLATTDTEDYGAYFQFALVFLHALQEFKSRFLENPPPAHYPYNQELDVHIVRAMQRIAADIRELLRHWVKYMQLGEYTIDMIDLLEVSWYPQAGFDVQAYTGGPPYPSRQSVIEMATIYWGLQIECAAFHLLGMPRVSDWPAEWFSNSAWICLPTPLQKELEHLVLVTESRESYPPTLPACFHAYLHCQGDKDRFQEEMGSIPLGTFRMVDQLGSYIPDWTPRMPNKYDGFVFPWWLQGSSQYAWDFQKLRGGKIFKIAYEYFQHAWPPRHPSMGDQIDGWTEAKVDRFMKSLREVTEQIEGKEGEVKHLLAQWAALSRLVGMPDIV
ncbi:hypothetical protein EDD15DRAFT_2196002 [Pisolithus albus]|nr:hypothetical protein EDD15DRAFT_2196002 [Pisolithus albus]